MRPQREAQGGFDASRSFRERAVNVDRAVFTMAGTMVLISLALGWLVSPY